MAKALQIDPKRWYTLQEIVEGNMFSWAGSYWSVRKIVSEGAGKKILCPMITGKGTNVRYKVQGVNISKFIRQVESGTAR